MEPIRHPTSKEDILLKVSKGHFATGHSHINYYIDVTDQKFRLAEARKVALELAKEYLDEGQTTVGAEVSCKHLAPTPVGMKVTATARLKKTERRKMWFDIEVHDEKGLCGKGSHLRVKVNSKAMKDKGAAKAQT